MQQKSLFPPPGALTNPLPDGTQREVRHLLAELLAIVLPTATAERIRNEGSKHEQDPQRPS